MQPKQTSLINNPVVRIRFWYVLLTLVFAVFVIRLFYLEIIRHDYYRKAAISSQLKEYEIQAPRGGIKAHDGEEMVSIVLNEPRYTLFADPKYVKDPKQAGLLLANALGGQAEDYETKLRASSRYAVLAKKLTKEQKDKVDQLKLLGIGTKETAIRTYPQGSLAAQLLGFVNDDGNGTYGIEQYLDAELKGKPGELKAITDAQGVPLAANKDNIEKAPEAGKTVELTIDIPMQKQLEDLLKSGLDSAKSKSGSALIMDPYTGAIKAMANYPTFNPAEFYKVEDASVFSNPAVMSPLEVGSVMKPLTAAAAIDKGVVNKNTTYYDPSKIEVDGFTIKNIEEDGGPGTRSVQDILQLSLNTGATWLLEQMGGGQINAKARTTWYDYMTKHYGFGAPTGIEQGYENGGTIPDPNKGYGLNLQYANTSFGQGMTATPLQIATALSSVVNGGTYYRPRLVDGYISARGEETPEAPDVVRENVISGNASQQVVEMMEYVASKNIFPHFRDGYSVGGKTGTAQIAKPGGGYYDDKYNGMYMGFVGGAKPQYVIVVRVNEPKKPGYAGSQAAQPIFVTLANMLINNFDITPKM